MLLVLLYTRHLVFLPLASLCTATARLHISGFTHAETAHQLALVQARNGEILALRNSFCRSEASRKKGEREITTLNALLSDSRLATERLKNPHLNALTSSKDVEIARLTTDLKKGHCRHPRGRQLPRSQGL
jgi:type IV secretory pathway TraG/TraD family ATPase VirD4